MSDSGSNSISSSICCRIKALSHVKYTRGDSLEVAGRADVGLGQLLLLAFGLLVLAVQPAVAQHVVEVVRLLVAVGVVESDVVDLRVLDVHRGHVQSWTCRRGGRNHHQHILYVSTPFQSFRG